MKSANIPHLYIRNGIYYYRNQSVWKSLRTRCKKDAFRKVSHILFGTTPAENTNQQTLPNQLLHKSIALMPVKRFKGVNL